MTIQVTVELCTRIPITQRHNLGYHDLMQNTHYYQPKINRGGLKVHSIQRSQLHHRSRVRSPEQSELRVHTQDTIHRPMTLF